MTMASIGDLSRQFITQRHNTQIRQELDRLTREMSTGKVADLTAHLGADQLRLGDIDRQLAVDNAYLNVARNTGQLLSVMQVALGKVDTTGTDLAAKLIGINPETPPAQQIAASSAGAMAFADMVAALNTSFGGTTLFGGVATDAPALASADIMLASIRAAAIGSVSAADVTAAVDAWFDTPGGSFETIGYLGNVSGPVRRGIDADQAAEIAARADAPAIRDQLKAAAMAALATDPALGLGGVPRANLLADAGLRLAATAESLAYLRADLGLTEQRVETATAQLAARSTAYGIMRNEMTSANPYTTASGLQAVQIQLETHYAVTARMANLSLVGYLR